MKLLSFKKGIHPEEFKHFTSHKQTEKLPLPDEVCIPLQQHIGAPCTAIVEKGEEVKIGQVIGRSESFVSSPVHSTVTGKIKTIDSYLHPAGTKTQMVKIQRTGEDDWHLLEIPKDWQTAPINELNSIIHEAGIVGLGGAAFPTHIKLSPPKEKKIDSFIINGCECEPFLTSDHRAMLEMTDEILTGMAIIMKVLGVEKGYIGIESNKPDAIAQMTQNIQESDYNFKVIPLKVKYPQGAEKMLIDAVLKRKVPTGGLPMDVGVVVNNVGTAIAVTQAVVEGKPLVERIVTVSGDGVPEPKNLLTRIGTSFQQLIEVCGGLKEETSSVYMGGPMMGISQWDLSVPVVKATSGIVCRTEESTNGTSYPCIQCGTCVSACPMFLLPTKLARYSEHKLLEEASKIGILNCVECGSCAFVCPSHIPLVQWIRLGKMKVGEMLRSKN